ncbi:2177_t:CDS:1, partial [Funneliformis caledonium]
MSDSESLSSDNSDNENFLNDFIKNISDDSESEDKDNDDLSYNINISSLTLE